CVVHLGERHETSRLLRRRPPLAVALRIRAAGPAPAERVASSCEHGPDGRFAAPPLPVAETARTVSALQRSLPPRPAGRKNRVQAMNELAGRVALVTGASGGIGAAVAERLAAAGAHPALHYARNAWAAEDLQRRLGGDALAIGADLADPAAPARLVDAVERE